MVLLTQKFRRLNFMIAIAAITFAAATPRSFLNAAENDGEKKMFPALFSAKSEGEKNKNAKDTGSEVKAYAKANAKTKAKSDSAAAAQDNTPAGADTEEEANLKKEREEQAKKLYLNAQSILLNNDIVAYYGHPNSKGMGILGRMSKENLLARLTAQAEEYRAVSGGRNIIKALYIIYGTVQPEGRIGYIGNERLKEYIDFAAQNDMLVFLDHQIGKFDPVESLKLMLPFLKEYSNVHLALDPEWRTTIPMQEIGTVTGEEINRAQEVMQKYIIDNNIPGERLLVMHQFNAKMISNRRAVKADFERVRLVLCMDGHGSPAKKRGSYEYNALATNIPVKAFKLFYNEKGNTGVDEPILTPKQVYELNPRPMLIMYQ